MPNALVQPARKVMPTCRYDEDRSRDMGMSNEGIPGVLLAGGLARRMGGGDKPMRQVGGRIILERVIARLKPQCGELILNANGDPARFGLSVIPDTIENFPRSGRLAASRRMAARTVLNTILRGSPKTPSTSRANAPHSSRG
jgi:hypothetical protein